MRAWLVAVCALWGACAGAQDFRLERDASFEGADKSVIHPVSLVVDPNKVALDIVAVKFEFGLNEGSVRAIGDVLDSDERWRHKPLALANGGLSSYRADVPLGLLIVDGRVYGRVSREKTTRVGDDGAKSEGFRWSGILCQRSADAVWDIVTVEQYAPDTCRQALQSGPLLVEPDGVPGIDPKEPERRRAYARTAVCLMGDRRLRLVVVAEPTHLYPFAQWLARPVADGGAGCRVALNLSGDLSSGLLTRGPAPGKKGAARPGEIVGPGSYPVPTVLLFTPRR